MTEIEDSLCELKEIKTGVTVNCLFEENLDALNEPVEAALNYCSNCGQRIDWSE